MRTSKHDEVMKAIKGVQDSVDALVEAMAESVTVGKPSEETMTCPAHLGEPMFKRRGRYGDFWSHGKEIGPGRWINCTGNGYRPHKVESEGGDE